MDRILLASNVEVSLSNQIITIDIYRNENGNLEFVGLGSCLYEMFNDELILMGVPENY